MTLKKVILDSIVLPICVLLVLQEPDILYRLTTTIIEKLARFIRDPFLN